MRGWEHRGPIYAHQGLFSRGWRRDLLLLRLRCATRAHLRYTLPKGQLRWSFCQFSRWRAGNRTEECKELHHSSISRIYDRSFFWGPRARYNMAFQTSNSFSRRVWKIRLFRNRLWSREFGRRSCQGVGSPAWGPCGRCYGCDSNWWLKGPVW